MIILIQISRADFKKYNPKKKMKSSHFRQKNMTRFRLSPPLTGWIMQPEHCGLTSNKLHPSEHSFAPCFSASSKINGMNGGEPRTFSEQQKRREGIWRWNGSVTPIVQLICTTEKKKHAGWHKNILLTTDYECSIKAEQGDTHRRSEVPLSRLTGRLEGTSCMWNTWGEGGGVEKQQ